MPAIERPSALKKLPADFAPSGRCTSGALIVPATVSEAGKRRIVFSLGAPVRVRGFLRFALGEGVDKKETDFAAEDIRSTTTL